MSLTTRPSGRRAAAGGVTGVAAYLIGYLAVYVTQRARIEERLEGFNFVTDLFGGDPIPAWQAVGWVFYNAHGVATEVPQPFGGVRVENFVSSADGGSLAMLFVVPPILLIAGGIALAALGDANTPGDGAAAGALVAVGYFPLAVAGTFVFRYAVGEGTVAPDPVTAVLLAGIVFPVVFGAVGGAVGGFVRGER